jgi:hypothetical protein
VSERCIIQIFLRIVIVEQQDIKNNESTYTPCFFKLYTSRGVHFTLDIPNGIRGSSNKNIGARNQNRTSHFASGQNEPDSDFGSFCGATLLIVILAIVIAAIRFAYR